MRNLEVNVTALESSYDSARYRLIEPTGEPVRIFNGLDTFSRTAFAQKPAALKAASSRGWGVYDMNEGKVIQDPDPLKRMEGLQDNIDATREKIANDEKLIDSISVSILENPSRVEGPQREDRRTVLPTPKGWKLTEYGRERLKRDEYP